VSSLTTKTENWLVHARVISKTEVKRWDMSRTSGQLFHFVLQDSSGEIRCTAFDDAVEKFYYLLQVDQEYSVTNGKIRKKQEYGFEMSINSTSQITPLNAAAKQASDSAFAFATLLTTLPPSSSSDHTYPHNPAISPHTSPPPLRSILKTSSSVKNEEDPEILGQNQPESVKNVSYNLMDGSDDKQWIQEERERLGMGVESSWKVGGGEAEGGRMCTPRRRKRTTGAVPNIDWTGNTKHTDWQRMILLWDQLGLKRKEVSTLEKN